MVSERGEVSIAGLAENLPVHQVKLGIQNEELRHAQVDMICHCPLQNWLASGGSVA